MKTEIWNNHPIRFVEKSPGEWWAVASDIAKAMGFRDAHNATLKMNQKYKGTTKVSITSEKAKAPETQEMIVLNEKGLYRLIMRSNKPEAEAFQDWVYEVIQTLRQESGLASYEVFRMLDKEHQKQAMQKLKNGLTNPVRVDFIKANTIANKAVSSMHGFPKMVKKGEMSPAMLKERETVLDDTVRLMEANDSFSLGLSVSGAVYRKYS